MLLYEINPDKEGTKYPYSEELFKEFYGRLRYYCYAYRQWNPADTIDLVKTKEDHELDGCRIWDKKGYAKLYECRFLIEVTEEESLQFTREYIDTLLDLVEYLTKE